MLFSSIIFLFLFLPIVLSLYFLLPGIKPRNSWLIFASLFFYAWGEKFFVIAMLISIIGNYYLGLWVDRYKDKSRQILILAIVFNLGLLFVYKYLNFIVDNINFSLGYFNLQPVKLRVGHLPAGISFFTFHALSYVIDIYQKTALVQKDLGKLTLYISFFPQLIAGPIIRYHDIDSQLSERVVTAEDLAEGVRRFIIGLGKKVLIANVIAEPTDQIFMIPASGLTPSLAWLGIIGYTLQIYFDFSGYSDMAIGLARMFGFHFLENFNYPYISKSIREFWRRWHISLSNWFRDYLYIPLGGNRCSPVRNYFNLVTVFFLCGLWHGASWNFIVWGLFHGIFLVLERLPVMSWIDSTWAPLRHGYALLVIMIGWVFFRTETLDNATTFLKAMFGYAQGDGSAYNIRMYLNPEFCLILILGIIGSTPVFPFILKLRDRILSSQPLKSYSNPLTGSFLVTGGAFLSFVFVVSVAKLASGTYNPFIYFRF